MNPDETDAYYLRLKCVALRVKLGKQLNARLDNADKYILLEAMKELDRQYTKDELTALFNKIFSEPPLPRIGESGSQPPQKLKPEDFFSMDGI